MKFRNLDKMEQNGQFTGAKRVLKSFGGAILRKNHLGQKTSQESMVARGKFAQLVRV